MPKSAKIVLLIVLGVAAVFVLLFNLGVFEGKSAAQTNPVANYTPEQQQQFQKEQQKRVEWEKAQKPPSGS